LLDTSQTTYNPSNVLSVGHPKGAYTFWQPVVDEVLSGHRAGAARRNVALMGEDHGGRSGMLTSPERIEKAS
jgi:hypothetical protein